MKACFALFLALSWFSSAWTQDTAPPKRILRVRALGDPQTLDWNRAHTWMDGLLLYNLMEGLVAVDSKLQPKPALAAKWSVSPDNRVYTFFLRKEVKWSDGVTLKASDFVASWRRLLDPSTQARYASILFDIDNAEAFNRGEIKNFSAVGVKALDESTLQVKLRASIAAWHWVPSMYATYPVRQDLIDKHPRSWDRPGNMVTVGPFTLASHEPGRTLTLKRNPLYHGKHGNIDEIALALVNDDTTALKLYDESQIDLLPKLPPLERKRLKPKNEFRSWPELRTIHLRFNTAQNPLANVALRRAIAMSIDKRKLSRVFEGEFAAATSFVPPGLMAYSPKAGHKFNPDRGKAELKAAGLDPAKLPTLDLLTIAFDDLVILAQFIQDELKRNLGLNVRIHILEPKRYYSPLLDHGEYAMQLNLWSADFPDADNFFSIFKSNSGLNRYGWKNPGYDKLVEAGRTAHSRKSREKAYLGAQKILLEDSSATLPMFYGRISGLVRDNVQGFAPGAINWWAFKDLSVVGPSKKRGI